MLRVAEILHPTYSILQVNRTTLSASIWVKSSAVSGNPKGHNEFHGDTIIVAETGKKLPV